MVKAGSQNEGVKALAQDMGIQLIGTTVLNSDASAAIGIGNCIGSGKVRELWLQEKVSQKVFVLNKVGTDDNPADALTKGVDAAAIQQHLEGVRIELRDDRHQIALELEHDEGGAELRMQDESYDRQHRLGPDNAL